MDNTPFAKLNAILSELSNYTFQFENQLRSDLIEGSVYKLKENHPKSLLNRPDYFAF